jgi:predicted outer membrane repeat protein
MFSFLKRSRKSPPAGRKSGSFRPACEALEDRLVPTRLTVVNPADTIFGGTLRWAVNQANADSARGTADTIVFANGLRGDTINLSSALTLTPGTQGVTIDATNDGITVSGKYSAFVINYRAQLTLKGVEIDHCSGQSGGAIDNNGSLVLTGCHFGSNHADRGGAVYNANTLTMSNCSFTSNSAQYWGGAIYTMGVTNVYSCVFSYNTAGGGGAVYNNGGQLWVLSTGNEFLGNKATQSAGGAIYNTGFANLNNATFTSNTTVASGGAIANFSNGNYLYNCVLISNSAQAYGGGFYDSGQGSVYIHVGWLGNHAGIKGPNYYRVAIGDVG